MRFLLAFMFVCVPATAQFEHLSLGVTGGIPFGRMTSKLPYGPDESRRYTFGVRAELSLNDNVSLDIDPLYKRTGVSYGGIPGFYPIILSPDSQIVDSKGRVRTHVLELPFVGKYTFRERSKLWRPFLGAGFAFQTGWQTNDQRIVFRNPEAGNTTREVRGTSELRVPADVGAVFSTGLKFRVGRLQYVPEVRYTRWGDPGASHGRNQVQLLFSIQF